ncbi:MAG: 4-(cytidine 5'-diphospho)-2-C-methyl-D-erythritol kinase [bacterium]|nr:4-(cytidine 5'-diphospho)-2-C-methyl-D-erythritol kinase [bacterium]
METVKLLSPAKVNLVLNVEGRRPDGYHDLDMVMAKISIYDEVSLSLKPEGVSLSCDNSDVPSGSENIAWKAASVLIEAKRLETGVHIHIEKNIPMGGGLGGGSADAATVLKGLNSLTGDRATMGELMEIGLSLGADVPFFLFEGGAARAGGVGEVLSPIEDLPELWMVLINPGVHVQTAAIFGRLNLGLTKNTKNHKIIRFNRDICQVVSLLHNDLESVTFNIYPEVEKAKDLLYRHGAAGALMSGSGSTVFGIYSDKGAAQDSMAAIQNDLTAMGWKSFLAGAL